jgi:tetratricopeptide (TPR) repeat protein
LDNAADTDQVRPLLPNTAGCPVLVTSRRSLTDLETATHLAVDVFTPGEALQFLTHAAPEVPAGPDLDAASRITYRCGYLPLALGLVAAHIRATPGWTLTDHADRLDERHHHRHLDSSVELAVDLSYRQLPTGRRRLLRLAALHPGHELDAHAAAALADTDLPTAQTHLDHLCRDHLLQHTAPGRYTFHDLVRAHATDRAGDEDPPPERRAALTRLFDFYLATAAAAMDTLYPGETHRRPRIPPAATPMPGLTDPDTARAWLDTERPTLIAAAAHTSTRGWPTHTTRLSATLLRYLAGGYHTDALAIHGHAHHAAERVGDPTGQAHELTNLGAAHLRQGRYRQAAHQFEQALALCRQTGDLTGAAGALNARGVADMRLGHYQQAADHLQQALTLHRQTGNHAGQALVLHNLSGVEVRRGRYQPAAAFVEQALILCRQSSDRTGEARALNALGVTDMWLGRYQQAADHLQLALGLFRQLGDRDGEAWTLDSVGTVRTHIGQPAQAVEHLQQALVIFRETGQRYGQATTLNGLGEAAYTDGRATDALTHHTVALAIAIDIGDRYQQARAHAGLGNAHHSLDNPVHAREHYQHALTLYTDLGVPEADQIRAHLAAMDDNSHAQR